MATTNPDNLSSNNNDDNGNDSSEMKPPPPTTTATTATTMSESNNNSNSIAEVLGKELEMTMNNFFQSLVKWIRGIQERKVLFAQLQASTSDTFHRSDPSGNLFSAEDWLSQFPYGHGAIWMTLELEIRSFKLLQPSGIQLVKSLNISHYLVTFELWESSLKDDDQNEITARRVTAWLTTNPNHDKTDNYDNDYDNEEVSSYLIVHIHETWIEGQGPGSSTILGDDAATLQSEADTKSLSQRRPVFPTKHVQRLSQKASSNMNGNWKKSNVPSRRRHISTDLDRYNAKPLLWENQIVGISIHGWDIGTSQGPIGDEPWFAEATRQLEEIAQYDASSPTSASAAAATTTTIAQRRKRRIALPEMVYPAAHVAIERIKGDMFLSWDALDALREWAEAHQAIPLPTIDGKSVSHNASFRGVKVLESSDAELWKKKDKQQSKDKTTTDTTTTATSATSSVVFHYDWTYSTPFIGQVYGAGTNPWIKLSESGMPMKLLTDQSVPILFFDEILLLEDDLHDNGEVSYSIKMRVMPTCVYLLSKLWVRVDNVILRLRECRVLVEFATLKIYRDVTWRECRWTDLAKHGLPTDLRAWTQEETKETPAFLYLLSKLPVVGLPPNMYAHAEMFVEPPVGRQGLKNNTTNADGTIKYAATMASI